MEMTGLVLEQIKILRHGKEITSGFTGFFDIEALFRKVESTCFNHSINVAPSEIVLSVECSFASILRRNQIDRAMVNHLAVAALHYASI